ncbi:Pleiotropic drug resistance protein 3 isoform D [Senna tora]|uniref:Pleiotropic drug resistance protein 3 isoform D n=1 Tax=Senna tora TaxID=362788 RepID=A0A834X517_9FABA|nr:Pleiotropic drug resistance protein 3 isoform D [Senna tora]
MSLLLTHSESVQQAFKKQSGPPQWHHGAFHDVQDSVRSDVRRMLHSRAEVPFQVPLEVNVVLVGFSGDGGYRYSLDAHQLEQLLKISFPSHRPSCLETGELLDIEHHLVYNAFPAGQPELIALEKALKEAMVPAGKAREVEFGRELPLFEVEATAVEPIFQKLYSYIFDMDNEGYSVREMDRPVPITIFIVNFDKLRMDPTNKEIDLDSLMYGKLPELTEDDIKKQEGDYIYHYRYNGGGSTQVWLGSGRFVVIDLSAGPCTYGKIEAEEGSVSSRTLPRLRDVIRPRSWRGVTDQSSNDIFLGQLASLISTTVEHVIAPDVRFETLDLTSRLLIPIIVLRNHNRYNIMEKGHNYSINVEEIEKEVKKMLHDGQEVVIIGGVHSLHRHEKLAIAVSKSMRGHSLQETKNDGRFHVHTKMYLDGALLKEEMERSADVLAAGLLEVADPSLSSKFFLRQNWMDEPNGSNDSIIKHKPLWASYDSKTSKKKKKKVKKQGDLQPTYGTRVIPVFVLSLADVDPNLMMEDESLVWTSNDVVIVLEHQNEKIPLSYVSETQKRHAFPSQAQRHILAGLASVVGGLSAPYEKASHVHERPVVNWLWATGCHPFGPFSNTSHISQMLHDVALRNTIYARVDSALRRIRETSESVQAFAAEYLKTPLGEPVKGKKDKSATELWLEKFYKKTTNLPEPFPHELVDRLERYLDGLEEQLVDMSSLLYDHRLQDAFLNSSDILQSTMFTQQYVDHVLASEREKMRCCSIEYKYPVHSSQTYIYGGILIAGFFVYFVIIFFSSPVR